MPAKRRMSPLLAVIAALGCLLLSSAPSQAAITAQPVATNLEFPSMFTFAPDGRIYYAERFTGEIRVLNPATGSNSLVFTVPNVCTSGEQGLFGLALHPFHSIIYAYAVRNVSGACRLQLLMLDRERSPAVLSVLLTGPTSTGIHNGGRIMFGADRRLYVATGDAGTSANAQNLGNIAGKVLRVTTIAGIPPDNPFSGSPIFAYGLRNVFGFDFDPQTGIIWATENGPECNDEVNTVLRGRNLGWGPSATCSTPPSPPTNTNRDGPNPLAPRFFNANSQAPTGLAFCAGCGLGADSEGRLFYALWETGEIRRVVLSSDRLNALSQTTVYRHRAAGPLSIEQGPDGRLYLSDQSAIYRLVLTH